jgi:ABC-type Na+ efflux pump permease subunit
MNGLWSFFLGLTAAGATFILMHAGLGVTDLNTYGIVFSLYFASPAILVMVSIATVVAMNRYHRKKLREKNR